ncbi:hypothetical protein SNOG_08114 [Parastagonospora nodorum SN15]|uniref:Uncharacterized protein n=1 Tax=Phaeosphaeria nodorum (strain SN15 / ATCC MYA-4574 / FGSC 10173) TaxID=321614 RepID=Q0UJF0_PHANO|nr:hypothetical protein SNOG_08114 [Parastagonospora nodorum SN15]EAT84390.1 hypothetical protein SNOG_08114 [Parastagonospora nodorum SN15]
MSATKFVRSLRVTSAVPGRVKFELDIQKEHTVRPDLLCVKDISLKSSRIDSTSSMAER